MSRVRDRLSGATGGMPMAPLLILFGLNAVDELDRSVFAILTPTIRDAFGLDNTGIFSIIALVSAFALLMQVPIGFYADRGPRSRIALGGAGVWAVFTLLSGLAPIVGLFVVARSFTALGRAVNDPTHRSLIADYYPPDSRLNAYSLHYSANSFGQIVGPVIGGALAALFGWRAPFLVFWIPTVVLVLLGLKYLHEPVRGAHERAAGGASDEAITTEEPPPSFGEAWRISYQVRTLRRIWFSLPFLALAFIGFTNLASILYEDVYDVQEFQRGLIAAVAEPFQLLGLAVGIPIAARLSQRHGPAVVLKFLSWQGMIIGACIAGFALSPNLPFAIVMHVAVTSLIAVLVPAIVSTLSLAIPPRVRSVGFSMGAVFVVPGVLLLLIIGAIADSVGVRGGLLAAVPVMVIGGFVIASAGRFVDADISRVRASTASQAEVLAARRRGEAKLLLVRNLDVGYDGVQVLFGVDFEVDEGEIIALLGTNGAGKSTLLKAISGLLEPTGGAVVFDGLDSTYAPPHEVAARGIVQVPGGKGVFPGLTVAENLKIAGWLYQRDKDYLASTTEKVFGYFPVLRDRLDQPAGNLSGGEQQMLTLGMAFIAKPRLLMIDELSLGLAPIIVEQLLRIVRAIREQGTTIILVEQSVNVALTVADEAYFMEKGEIRFRGPTADLLGRPDVLRSVFLEGAAQGRTDADEPDPAPAVARRTPATPTRRAAAPVDAAVDVLEVRGITRSFGGIQAVSDVSFTLRKGEILGIIGPNGAGKTTVFDMISGFVVPDIGRILLHGDDVTELLPDARARRGLGRSFQDARLFPALTVAETIAVALERQVEVRDPIAAAIGLPAVLESEERVAERVDELIDLMALGAFRDKFVSELSTGSRRIVDLACILAHEPSVLLFDEPSSGIAQRETEALGPLLLRIREQTGASLLVIEHDMPLITSISDELLALDLGRTVVRGLPHEVVHDERVVTSYLGGDQAVITRSGSTGSGGDSAERADGERPRPATRRRPAAPAKKAAKKAATTVTRRATPASGAAKKTTVRKSATKKTTTAKKAAASRRNEE